jgi:arylsulfatase A-like enzyme
MSMRRAMYILTASFLVWLTLWVSTQTRRHAAALPKRTPVYAEDGELLHAHAPKVHKRNLIILMLDTVRRDVVSLGDEPPAQMPFVSQLGKTGLAFRQATSPAPWTIPTVASLFTGMLPHRHKCKIEYGIPHLESRIATYAEILSKAYGYETAVFAEGHWCRGEEWSLLQGFEQGSAHGGRDEASTMPGQCGFSLHTDQRRLDDWVARRDPHRPFFLFLHTFDAHDPYGAENHDQAFQDLQRDAPRFEACIQAFPVDPRAPDWQRAQIFLTSHVGRYAYQRAMGMTFLRDAINYMRRGYAADPVPNLARELENEYRKGVRWTDDGVRKLVAKLRHADMLENTMLVVLSDHGEAFGEHGLLGHSNTLHEELIRVPMVITGPAPFATPRVIDEVVGTVDVLPTFLDWIGAIPRTDGVGRSLLPLLRGEEEERPVVSDEHVLALWSDASKSPLLSSVRSRSWKFICEYQPEEGRVVEHLYALDRDPKELHNLIGDGRFPPGIVLQRDFCQAIENIRDRIWGAAQTAADLELTPYAAGVARTAQTRPPPCGSQ